ncbi:MAG: DUF3575 domain-containing protein [Muribaculaceae bacterium]|nr:DUF3575 domain-containing protein [Muribaculaceae bacterium]
MKKRLLIILVSLLAIIGSASAQKVALKSNLLADALLSPNLALEIGLSPKWTLDIPVQGNFWNVNEHRWRHLFVKPEARYWFCERFVGHFLGFHAIGGEFNVGNIKNDIKFLGTDFSKLSDVRYQGWGAGAGISYGYDWVLNDHWNIEAEIGIGWVYTRYDVLPCAECGNKIAENQSHNYYGPTKAAISLVYLF